jgi:hypothetical protein
MSFSVIILGNFSTATVVSAQEAQINDVNDLLKMTGEFSLGAVQGFLSTASPAILEQARNAVQEQEKQKVQDVLESCERKMISASPQCAIRENDLDPNQVPLIPEGPIDEEGDELIADEEALREDELRACAQGFQACVNEELIDSSPIVKECRQKLAVFDGGKCYNFTDGVSNIFAFDNPACTNFYSTCIDQANWDAAAIAAVLAGGANGGGAGGSKYPVRMTPEEYRKLNTPIPYCAFTYEGCRDVNDVVTLMVNIGKMIFSLIGVLAFVMFVYGGFTMILAFGNPEKFKKGTSILVAALVGLLIAFSAYLLIDFVLDSLGVSANFRGV